MNVAGAFWERWKWPDLHYIDHVELHIIETHSPQSSSSFNMLGEFDFSDEKLQDMIGVLPQNADRNHLRKLGGANSIISTPFQTDIENPTVDYVPLPV